MFVTPMTDYPSFVEEIEINDVPQTNNTCVGLKQLSYILIASQVRYSYANLFSHIRIEWVTITTDVPRP